MAKLTIKNKYGITPNELLNNPDVSLKAKGLYGYLQSKPNEWKFSEPRIRKQMKEGRDAIQNTLKELEKLGYLQRISVKNEKGQWDGYDYILYEKPYDGKSVRRKTSMTGFQETLSKKDNSEKDIVKKNNMSDKSDDWDFNKILEKMTSDKRRHIHIISLYWKYKEIFAENKEQYQALLNRELRPSRQLVGFTDDRIIEVMEWLEEENDMKWTLETVLKYITEDLDNVKPIKGRKNNF